MPQGHETAVAHGDIDADDLVVFGGELGLCGSYNARVVDAAVKARAELGPGPTFCVGHRAAVLLARRVPELQRSYAAPTSIRGITDLLLRLAEEVLGDYVTAHLSSLHLVALSYRGVGLDAELRQRLLPFRAVPQGRPLPLRYVEHETFAAAGVRELLYMSLYGALLDALAAEQSARLVATQAAEKWLHERSEALRRRLLAARREASTQEVIEIATGARCARMRARKIPQLGRGKAVPTRG